MSRGCPAPCVGCLDGMRVLHGAVVLRIDGVDCFRKHVDVVYGDWCGRCTARFDRRVEGTPGIGPGRPAILAGSAGVNTRLILVINK